jgi:hypothetical protein
MKGSERVEKKKKAKYGKRCKKTSIEKNTETERQDFCSEIDS